MSNVAASARSRDPLEPSRVLCIGEDSGAQKHVTHNEALELLGLLVQLAVEAFDAHHPPDNPEDGQVWEVG